MTAALETSLDSFKCRRTLKVDGKAYDYFSLKEAEENGLAGISSLPFSLKVLLENLLRHEDGRTVTADDIRGVADWLKERKSDQRDRLPPGARADAGFHRRARGGRSGRDARRDGRARRRSEEDQSAGAGRSGHRPLGDGRRVRLGQARSQTTSSWNMSATASATRSCAGAQAPSTISAWCRRAPASATRSISNIWRRRCGPSEANGGDPIAYPDTLVGTDSHTTMVNGLCVLGWGVGGIEAEAAMLGQPISMLIPEVVGFKLTGELNEGVTATDLVLTVTQMLREKGVVGKFVEFFGPGLDQSAARRPRHHRQHGAGIWRDLRLLPDRRGDARLISRPPAARSSASRWSRPTPRRKGCVATRDTPDPVFTDTLELDLGDGRAVARRAEAPAGPGAADRGRVGLRRGARQGIRQGARGGQARAGRRAGISISATATW